MHVEVEGGADVGVTEKDTDRFIVAAALNASSGEAVSEDDYIVSVMAAMCVDAQLIDDLVVILAPVL